MRSLLGALIFYTCIPLPQNWDIDYTRIARWAPLIGILLGGGLGLLDLALQQLGMPILTRSTLIIALGIALTGGLHLDGVADTADGLAVQEPKKRIKVMQDSVTGAFGVMAIAIVLMLKIAALGELNSYRWLFLMLALGWGRWAQVLAIALYPYLKPQGKGAFHKQAMQTPQDVLLGLFLLLSLAGFWLYLDVTRWWLPLTGTIGGIAIAGLTGVWLQKQLGGQTGDTYGAIVEWTEALWLCFLTMML